MIPKSACDVTPGRRAKQSGSAMVELALTFMAFALLMFGIMDFGWAVYAQTFCYTASQDAVRWASVHGSESSTPAAESDVQTYIRNEAVGLITSNVTVLTCWYTTSTPIPSISANSLPAAGSANCPGPTGNNSPGSNVLVVVQYPFSMLSGLALKQNLTFSSTAVSVINN